MNWIAVFVTLLSVTFAATGLHAQNATQTSRAQPEAATGWQDKAPVVAEKHMAVVANPLAAEVARDTLRKGGNAVDAAIAAQLVLNLVEPQSSGLGGGGFLVHW
ncbi:MAG: gamma-glutamyltransferase, partial [Hyphomicrobiaceae bacterium]|nr:gamma-glutamyltransferase [Hyphomicrobiaceae bacterium]